MTHLEKVQVEDNQKWNEELKREVLEEEVGDQPCRLVVCGHGENPPQGSSASLEPGEELQRSCGF